MTESMVERVAKALFVAAHPTRASWVMEEDPARLDYWTAQARAAIAATGVERLREALEQVGVGGNHLANILVQWLGPDFAKRFPATLDPMDTREQIPGFDFDVWCAWRAIMLTRAALAEETRK